MASHNDKAAQTIAETSNLVDELTREMGIEDAPTELDLHVAPTAFDPEDIVDPNDWRAHQSWVLSRTSSGGASFEFNSGPLKGVFWDAPSAEAAIRKGNSAMDRTPPIDHIKHIYERFSENDDYLGGLEARLEKTEARTAGIGVALLGIVAGGLLGALLAKQAPAGLGRPKIGGGQ